ncbi:MAG: hypothetical protein K2W95_36650 [Candidatus Obscuribacterales bacterium]|nr:hypothetical protein [Candidatus Obscuribacterales bacterium]
MTDDLTVVRDSNGKGIGFRSPSRQLLTRQIAESNARRALLTGEFVPPPPAPMFSPEERARYEAMRTGQTPGPAGMPTVCSQS